ncbi:MAG TPA: glycosyltransferase family 2 protein [Thermoanaerobaculia bacterium]|jgi:GT2 family glycosyltransferase|nr:glycosyltransferase family 2 protein [Thermoanaerobaculia bacterium]
MERGLTNGLVSVIIVSWNSARFLERCLAALAKQTHNDIELIHIDNASDDDSIAIVRNASLSARQIINDTNRGFSAAVNQGVRIANGEFVLLLNPDAFLEPEYVERLVAALNNAGESFGMATGKLLQAESGLIDSMGIRMTRSGRHFDVGQGARESGAGSRESELGQGSPPNHSDTRHPAPDTRNEVFGVSGASALYRMSFVRDVTIGGEFLDEDFFAFREDADVAWRGRLFGWRAVYVPDAVGHHVRTVTPEKRGSLSAVINMHGVKNRFLLRLKNEGMYLALRNAPFELGRDLVVIIAALTIERTSLPALSWLWKNRRRIMEKRRAIQSRRRVADRQIAGWFR